MKIEEQKIGRAIVIKPDGPLAASDSDAAKGYLIGAMTKDDCDTVILDASMVAFMDSRGLEAMVDVSDRLGQSGSKLVIAGANETLRDVLDLTEISHLFKMSESVEAAVRSSQ